MRLTPSELAELKNYVREVALSKRKASLKDPRCYQAIKNGLLQWSGAARAYVVSREGQTMLEADGSPQHCLLSSRELGLHDHDC